jgi:ketosteroid isomerase-like protein
MSHENVDVVKHSLDAWNRQDFEAIRAVNDPYVELDWSASRGVEAGIYRGIEAVLHLYKVAFDAWQETVIEPDRFIDAGESVVVPNVGRQVGRDGIVTTARSTFVYTVRNRRITRICLYQGTEEALRAVGLEE